MGIVQTLPIVVAVLAVAAFFIGFSFLVIRGSFDIDDIQWFLIPLIAVSLLPLAFVGDSLKMVFSTLLILCFCIFEMLQTLTLSDIMHDQHNSAIAIFSAGRLPVAAGAAFGWLLGFLVFSFDPLGSVLMTSVIVVVVLAMVFELAFQGRPQNREQETVVIKEPENEGRWRQRCTLICQQAQLSQRQREVFMLLAKGRNAKFIADSLFIASHTAKAHIYRIYQKLDLHSQQELIDYVENSQLAPLPGTSSKETRPASGLS
jgi:DNA-binding CsgD family transcriptional regulator